MAEPTTERPIFYRLPASDLEPGMSTADGQDILDMYEALGPDGVMWVYYHVYTPADDPTEDAQFRLGPEIRVDRPTDWVDMADFPNTPNPGHLHGRAEVNEQD